jgi:hypothetical protein
MNNMAHEFDMLVVLQEIRDLLKKQNEILEKQQTTQPQTKITVVGNKTQNAKGLKNNEDFTL